MSRNQIVQNRIRNKHLEGDAKKYYDFFDQFSLILEMGGTRVFRYEWKRLCLCKGHFKVVKIGEWKTPPCKCDPNPLALRMFQCKFCGNIPEEGEIEYEFVETERLQRNANFIEKINTYGYEQKKWIEQEINTISKEEYKKRIFIFVQMLKEYFEGHMPYILHKIEYEANTLMNII